jgi:arylsulfatase A-like enzyme
MPTITRRQFGVAALGGAAAASPAAEARPNILWLTCEDTGPHLHACGDDYSVTPNLDRLAARGQIFMNAWSNAPVCAPARTTIITGMYPPSLGAEHMRSMAPLPAGIHLFPQFLREAGYYCTNNVKEDYNVPKPAGTWDESSNKAHWRKRAAGQPFFSVFNNTITHESQIRTRPHQWVHDPAKVRLPAYHPDTIEVRRDWAQYYDNITTMDGWAGRMLADLEADGLADDTIVVFFGDHGSGMPRSKRTPCNSGLNVSIVVSVPEKWRHLAPADYRAGAHSDRLIGFVDLAPTMLSVAGLRPAAYHQGRAFMGRFGLPEGKYNYGFRGRMDERQDMVRSVRDKRYVYVRNYMPHRPQGQHNAYMFETPTTAVWKKLYDEGKLQPPKTYFWEPKANEELYDLKADRDEVVNLAGRPEHRATLERMRAAQRDLARRIHDIGFLPEGEIHSRSHGSTPYETAQEAHLYPQQRIMDAAEAAASETTPAATLVGLLNDSDSAVRYWGAIGFLIRKQAAPLTRALKDESPYVRIVAAEAVGRYGEADDLDAVLGVLVAGAPPDRNGIFVSVAALNALDALGKKAAPALKTLEGIALEDPKAHERYKNYVGRLVESIKANVKV